MEDRALSALGLLWQSSPEPVISKNGVVLVDLMHGNTELLLRNLVVAKFVQRVTGKRLVGILGSPGVVTRSTEVNTESNRRLADAFGISTIVEVPAEFAVPETEETAFADMAAVAASADNGMPLPDSLQDQALCGVRTGDGFRIGRIVKSTFMRSELQAVVLAGERLTHWAGHVLGFDHWVQSLIAEHEPAVLVTGHIDYCPWEHLAERLVRTGVRVVWYRCDARIPIVLIDDLDSEETLNGRVRRIEQEAFAAFEARLAGDPALAERWTQSALMRARAVRNGLARHWRWVTLPDDTERDFGFGEARTTYVLFTHTFTDQPVADTALFTDYTDWLESTLQHAVQTQAYNLIVKVHPFDPYYDVSGTAGRLAERFGGHDNIRFVWEPIPPEVFLRTCAAAITVRGTPGIEMSMQGLPVILAGQGPYSGIGFCLRPETREAYFDLLEQGPPFPANMEEQSRRAVLYQAFDRFWTAPATPLSPAFTGRPPDDAFWNMIENATRLAVPDTDPLYLALLRAWPRRNAKVAAVEFETALAGPPSAAPDAC